MRTPALVFAFWILAACSVLSETEPNSGANDVSIGRFQIVSGQTRILSQKGSAIGSERSPVIIKIDTKTGDTWILVTQFDNETNGQGWVMLGDYFSSRIPKKPEK